MYPSCATVSPRESRDMRDWTGDDWQQFATLLVGVSAGSVAMATSGAVGCVAVACAAIFAIYLRRYFTQTQRSGSSQSGFRILGGPLLSHEHKVDILEDEIGAHRSRLLELEAENEKLRIQLKQQSLFDADAVQPRSVPQSIPKISRHSKLSGAASSGQSASPSPDHRVSAATLGARTETAAVAERVAAEVEGLAVKTSSDLHVVIENESDEHCTVVRVTAPNRPGLLADLSAALSGLGLSIVRAQIKTIGTLAQNTFMLQEVVYPGGGRKIWGTERLAVIEGRLRQFFRRQAVQRLLKAKTL